MDRWRRLPTWAKWTIGILALLLVIGVAVPAEDSPDDSGSDKASETQVATEPPVSEETQTEAPPEEKRSEEKPPEEPADCGNEASDDCTPHVNLGGSVRVDALIWKVQSVRTATQLGDQELGLGEKADGRYVIVNLRVRSDKDESATLTGSETKLEVNGNTYDPDNDGTVAAIGAGEEPFFLEDIGPDSTITGKVVFDVPESVLSKKVEMRFNELGLGSTHGYIDISKQLG